MKKLMLALSIAAATGCASSTKEIGATYQTPLIYQNHSCDQLRALYDTASQRAIQLGAQVDKASTDDNVITGVTLLLFWPAVFALGGEEAQEVEYGQLKGRIDAIEQAAIAKSCSLPVIQQLEPVKKVKPAQEQSAKFVP
jgi:hypothetical protein